MAERVGKCRHCAGLLRDVERLEIKVSWLLSELTKAEKRVRQLQEALAGRDKDSTNSSKPPSSDIVKPPKRHSPASAAWERGRGPRRSSACRFSPSRSLPSSGTRTSRVRS